MRDFILNSNSAILFIRVHLRPSAFANMKTAFFLGLSTIFLCTSQSVAQLGTSLVLVKGDTPKSCSFTSDTILAPIPVVQGLLGVQAGDSPAQVAADLRFSPDQPYTNGVLQWTAVQGGQYVKAVVTFRNDGALKRFLTVATNYKQPNQKQCQWEIKDTQLGLPPQNNLSSPPEVAP